MNLRLILLLTICIAGISFGQKDKLYLHKPCFNDSLSVFSADRLKNDLILSAHDLIAKDSLPGKYTRSMLVRYSDSCTLQDAMLYHSEREENVSLNVSNNTGPVSISKNGKLLFLSNTYAGVSGENMGIYLLKETDYGWVIHSEFPFNSPEYSVMHPAYDEANGKLYFASNRESSFFNIWYTDFDGNEFGDSLYPLTSINASDANDVFPVYDNNKLYFSSDRKNLTNLKIYEASKSRDNWSYKEIEEAAFKSNYDDFAYNMISERTGFFASTRDTDGRKDELFAFRKRIDCSKFPNFANQRFIGETDTELKEALGVIEEFRNVFGAESELTYNLNVDYIREQITKQQMTISDFYCKLFNQLDSTSLIMLDKSVQKSIQTEKLVDSLFTVVSNDFKQEIIADSLIRVLEARYDDIGVKLEMQESKEALKEAYEPLKALADSLVGFSDTLKKVLLEKLEGFKIEEEKLPEFANKPKGLFFAIQVGAFSTNASESQFANLSEVIEVKGPKGIFHYITGFCNTIDIALKSQAQVRGVGYPDAFIVAYCDGERIPIFRAKELIASGECEPISKSQEPNIDYSIVVNRPGTDKPFTVKIDPNYNKAAGAAVAVASETREGLFYTIQIGVFDKPVTGSEIQNMPDLITTLLPNGQIRYSTGAYQSEEKAQSEMAKAVNKGFTDAFVTAYYQGKRIPTYKAKELLEEKGAGILEKF